MKPAALSLTLESTARPSPDEVHALCHAVRVAGPPWVSVAQEDSRVLAQVASAYAGRSDRILDVGTGTGIIAICLAKLGHVLVATDVSWFAVRTALKNAARNGVAFPCYRSDLLASVAGEFDLIVFNLPYSDGPERWAKTVVKNVLQRFQIVRRLAGSRMPTRVLNYRRHLVLRLVEEARERLNPEGRILFHVTELETAAFGTMLKRFGDTEVIHHSGWKNRTAGIVVRPGARGTAL